MARVLAEEWWVEVVGVEVSKKTANHGAGDDVLVFACQDPGLKVLIQEWPWPFMKTTSNQYSWFELEALTKQTGRVRRLRWWIISILLKMAIWVGRFSDTQISYQVRKIPHECHHCITMLAGVFPWNLHRIIPLNPASAPGGRRRGRGILSSWPNVIKITMNLAPCRIELPPSRRSNLGPSAFLGQPRVLRKRIEVLDGVLIMPWPATHGSWVSEYPNFDQFMGCFPKWASKPSFCGQNVQILISIPLFVGHFNGRPIWQCVKTLYPWWTSK